MMDEMKMIVWIVAIIFITIGGTITAYNLIEAYTAKVALDAGYSQQTLPGETGVFWVKPNGTKLTNP